MITAQGTDCVITLEGQTLVIVRFPGPVKGLRPAGHTMRVLPSGAISYAQVTAPGLWRRGVLNLAVDEQWMGNRLESVSFARRQYPDFMELAQALGPLSP